MYEFAALALLGLVTLKVVDLLTDLVPAIARSRTLAMFAVAIIAVVVLDYSVFGGFGITVRNEAIATVFTGLIAGSLAAAWQAVLGWFGSPAGAGTDGRRAERPRIAA
ncbi:MAG: hypothetical protein AB1673_03135 [Actinomycetota bacterium]